MPQGVAAVTGPVGSTSSELPAPAVEHGVIGEPSAHSWRHQLGGATVLIVNGVEHRIPLVCARCLITDDTVQADQPCTAFVERGWRAGQQGDAAVTPPG